MTRIPELEQELVAAAARLQSRRRRFTPAARAVLAAAVAVVLLTVVLVTSEHDADRRSQPAATQSSAEQRIEQIANKWATLFAASDPATCRYMTQSACEREDCMPFGAIANCTLPSAEYRKSFRDATVQEILIKGDRAGARFTNGEAVSLLRVRGGVWSITKFGQQSPTFFGDTTVPPRTPRQERQEMKRRAVQTANKWARQFAASDADACRFMTQPACERERCARVNPSGPTTTRIKGCTLPSAEYRRAFRGASVEEIAVRGRRAAARFTNGEAVELTRGYSADFWLIHKFGENAGRGFIK